MVLDFGKKPGTCHVMQEGHVLDLIEIFDEKLKGNSPSPASADLFKKGAGGLLNDHQRELFHTCVAKALFIANRASPDIVLAVSVLSGCVRYPTNDDMQKLRRLVDYLVGTKELHLVLSVEGGLDLI